MSRKFPSSCYRTGQMGALLPCITHLMSGFENISPINRNKFPQKQKSHSLADCKSGLFLSLRPPLSSDCSFGLIFGRLFLHWFAAMT